MDHHPFAYLVVIVIVIGTIMGHLTQQEVENFVMVVSTLAVTKSKLR